MATNSIFILLVLSISCLCSTRDVYIQPSEGEHCPGTCYNINTFGKILFWLGCSFLRGHSLLKLQTVVMFINVTNKIMLCLKVMGEWSRAFMRLSGSLQWSSSVLNTTPVLVFASKFSWGRAPDPPGFMFLLFNSARASLQTQICHCMR